MFAFIRFLKCEITARQALGGNIIPIARHIRRRTVCLNPLQSCCNHIARQRPNSAFGIQFRKIPDRTGTACSEEAEIASRQSSSCCPIKRHVIAGNDRVVPAERAIHVSVDVVSADLSLHLCGRSLPTFKPTSDCNENVCSNYLRLTRDHRADVRPGGHPRRPQLI